MSSYEGVEAEVFVEAMRLVPAIAMARARDAMDDTLLLYQAYLEDAESKGVNAEQAWSIIAAASSVWITRLLERQATLEGTCVHLVIDTAIASAQQWVLDGA